MRVYAVVSLHVGEGTLLLGVFSSAEAAKASCASAGFEWEAREDGSWYGRTPGDAFAMRDAVEITQLAVDADSGIDYFAPVLT